MNWFTNGTPWYRFKNDLNEVVEDMATGQMYMENHSLRRPDPPPPERSDLIVNDFFRVTFPHKKPKVWWRFWQRLLLGFEWEDC